MGVQGSGKSTIGQLLADRLDRLFIDGDDLHSPENIAIMAAGGALTDVERIPWLREIGRLLTEASGPGVVVACSALKRSYRDLLRESAPELFVVDPEGPIELVAARISARQHQYMPPALLESQYDTLEPLGADELGMIVDIHQSVASIVGVAVAALDVLAGKTVGAHRAH